MNELFKLPAFCAHYLEHRSLDSSIDLLEFLSMHYFGNDLNDNDHDRDMELPFKKIDGHVSFQIVFAPAGKLSFGERPVFPTPQLALPDSRDFNLSDPSSGGLFRPPIS